MSSRESRAVARGSSHRRDRSRELPLDLSRENTDELRIVLLGRTGAGKSATGNTILGRKAFKAELSFTSVTKDCQKESSEVNGRLVTVIDTPGLYNTELTNEEIQREISNCISMILPGPHVFIIVNSVGRFTQEDETLAKIIQEMFGEKSLRYAMVLFTGGDYQKNRTIEEYLGGKPRLMELIEACGNRYHVFNNKDTRDRTQVSDLLEKIDIMSEANGGSFYLMFKQMDREGLEQQTEILMDRARERGEKMRKLQEEKERMKMRMEEERQNHDKQRREELMEKDEEMRREQETFVNEIELLKQEKEKLQLKYDTDIERLEKEKKRREEEFNQKEERHQRDIKKREREEWEKRRLEEKTRREEEKEKQTPVTGPTNRFSGAEGEADDPEQLRIVLIGRTGSGKSATGNSILGRDEFVSQLSMSAVTTVCQKRVGEVDGRAVAVVDTPGLFDMTLSNDQVIENLMKCVSASAPGPHVFVIVLSLGRFDREEANTVDLIKKIFRPKTAHFSIVLFTGGDELGNESVEDYVKRNNSAELEKLIGDCGNRFLVFNNKEKRDRTQVIRLFHMIEELKHTNDSQYLTNSMFERAEMAIKKRMKEIMNEKEREIEAQCEAINAKYEMEMKNMMKRLEEEKRRADEERMKTQTQLREKEEKLRKEFEEKEKREQMKREIENQKRSEEEKQRRDEYHKNSEELKREIENLRLQNEKQQKEREEQDRKREEKNRRDLEKMIIDHERVIAELQMKHEEEIKKRDLEEKRRNEEEEEERRGWTRKIKEAENDRREIQEEMKRQQREWEDERKRQMREREEEERKRREKHEEQLREKQEELEKMRKRFEREREEERQKIEEERQKQRREREEKEREFEEKIHDMKRLQRESAEEWERRKREDDERREEERKRWMKSIEDVKREQEEEIKRREREEKERKEREETERNEMNKTREEEIKVMKKKHEEEARSRAELREFREEQHIQELQQMLQERHKHHELLEKLYRNLQEQRDEEIKELVQEIKKLKKNKSCCAIM